MRLKPLTWNGNSAGTILGEYHLFPPDEECGRGPEPAIDDGDWMLNVIEGNYIVARYLLPDEETSHAVAQVDYCTRLAPLFDGPVACPATTIKLPDHYLDAIARDAAGRGKSEDDDD